MTHRTDQVFLPADVSRCEPSSCSRKGQCARYLAAIPAQGASMGDFSKQAYPSSLWCAAYITVSSAKAMHTAKPKPQAKDWIGS